MAFPRLILVEGIPGAGKTSTARFIHSWLGQHGAQARLFLEGDLYHPADYESTACLPVNEYTELAARYPILADYSEILGEEAFVGYRKLHHARAPQALVDALAPRDVYELPAPDFCRVTRRHWQEFAAQAAGKPYTYVFECCFLQNQLTTLLAKHDWSPTAAAEQICAIATALQALDALMIYLDPPSIRATFERAAAERPRDWLDFVTTYITGQAWGQAHAQSGFDGLVRFYEYRREVERDLFPRLGLRGLWLDRAGDRWDDTRARLVQFLEATAAA